MTSLVPNRFLFTFEFPLRRRVKLPPLDGRLGGWTDAERLPQLGAVDGRRDFAPVWACWNQTGIAVACRVAGKRSPLRCDPGHDRSGDSLRICIDTRPSPDNKRATRFCRQFYLHPTGGSRKSSSDSSPSPVAGIGKFQRAREEPPPVDPSLIRVSSQVFAAGYGLEAFLPAECLPGFEPRDHPRLGFYYILEDTDHGRQFLTVGDDLLWYADPSTWALAQLA
jgi:hypothetical protein